MLNNNEINSLGFNYNTWENNTQNENEVVSSFSSSQITKYAIKTPLGQYFNVWSFGNYSSWVCGEWEQINYWNILLSTDIENLAEKEINTWNNPILNGGIIQNTRFSEKEIEFTIKIFSKDKKGLEKEVRDIKRNLNLKWLKISKKEFDRVSEIDVILQDIQFEKLSIKETEVTINFLSLDPNFKKPSWNTKAYRDIAWNLDVSLIINDTDVEPFLNTLIDIKELTWTITKIELEINWYKVEIDCNISNPEKVIFDWKKSEIFIWNTEIEDFKWKFTAFPINKPNPVKVKFIWGTVEKYSIYFTYDNIYL
jgi:hypothetical protein